jgi:micrococcal nuclease
LRRIVLFTCLLLLNSIATGQAILTGKVVSVADGDTLTILTGNNSRIKVRLHGIDCPERHQDFGTQAKLFTSDLSFGQIVEVRIVNKDRYGRTVGKVILPDGRMLNEELLRVGLAWHYKQFDKSAEFARLEQQARQNKTGLWSMKDPVAPWNFRRSGNVK